MPAVLTRVMSGSGIRPEIITARAELIRRNGDATNERVKFHLREMAQGRDWNEQTTTGGYVGWRMGDFAALITALYGVPPSLIKEIVCLG